MKIDCDFPGGNIIVEKTVNNCVYLRQDWSGSTEWWFYWSFRVCGAAGQKVRFQFTDRNVFSFGGPCVSSDRRNWRWLGRESAQENGFSFAFGPEENELYFSICPLYAKEHLREYLAARPAIQRNIFCHSEDGREVEHLLLPSQRGITCVVFTARMHACETMGNFVLEGILDFCANDAFIRENVDIHAVPFFDKDGVEKGEQGKNRAPHDHNRDFTSAPLYATTRALMEQAPQWRGGPGMFLDLHCPWIRDGRNEEIFLLGVPQEGEAKRARFSQILQESQSGPLVYDPVHTIPVGEDWYSGDAPTSARWAREQWEPLLSTTLEMPYSLAGGSAVTPEKTRAFGRDLGRALSLFLQEN